MNGAPRTLADTRLRAAGLPDLLLYEAQIAPGVLLLRDGAFLAAWRYRGPDLAGRTHAEMAALCARVGSLLKLGSGWCLHVDAIRSRAPGYPVEGAFPDPVTRVIDAERRQQFLAEGAHFESDTVLSLTYLPPTEREERLRGYLFAGTPPSATGLAQRALSEFQGRIQAFADVFEALMPVQRLGLSAHRLTGAPLFGGNAGEGAGAPWASNPAAPLADDTLLRHLRRCLSARDHPFAPPSIPVDLADVLGAYPLLAGHALELDREPLAVIAIEGFPRASHPGMLAALDALALEYRFSTRAILLDAPAARALFEAHRRRWRGRVRSFWDQMFATQSGAIDLDAQRMVAEAEGAMSLAASGEVQFALYNANIVLLRASRAALERDCREIIKTLRTLGFEARLEWLNALEAWLGTLPGDGYRNVRRQVLHTLNLADLLPLTHVWSGERVNPSALMPPDSPPLLHAATTGATPYRLNLHVSDVGHTLMVGPPGSGKSTALALLAAQWFRYPEAQVFAFDYRASLEVLTTAAGGAFVAIGEAGEALTLPSPADGSPRVLAGLCPLQDLDRPGAALWAVEWLEGLCTLQGLTVTPPMRHALSEAVKLLAHSPSRTLTELSANVQHTAVREALQFYTLAGPAGALLDAEPVRQFEGRFVVFELEPLMLQGERVVVPVLMALFREIEQRLSGAPTLVLIDEAWIALKHPLFRERLRDWLKTLRKLNATVVLATQNLSDVWNSPVRDVVLESCATKILLPNAEALHPASRALYAALGLNERECERLAHATPKREYYVVNTVGRRMIELGLGPVALAFTSPNSRPERAAAARLRARHGVHWPAAWLRERQRDDWATYLEGLIEAQRPS